MGMAEIIFLVIVGGLLILVPILCHILSDIDYKRQLQGKKKIRKVKEEIVNLNQEKNQKMEAIVVAADMHRKQDAMGPLR